MKSLIHAKPKVFIGLIIIIILSIALVVLAFTIKVESVYKTNLMVKNNKPSFIVSPSEIHHFSSGKDLVIKIDSRLYKVKVSSIYFDKGNNYFVMSIVKSPIRLMGNSVVPVSLVYEYKSLISSIVNV